jgi:hypothetical protein
MPILKHGVGKNMARFSRKTKIKENGYASIVETLVASVIIVIAVTAAGIIINSGLRISLQATNTTKALEHAQDTLAAIKAKPYSQLGLITSGGANQNIINLSTLDTEGCTPLQATFEGNNEIINPAGVPYCQIKTPLDVGVDFNVETHITEYDNSDETLRTVSNLETINTISGKKVTIIVTWFEGNLDNSGQPEMKSVKVETIITPPLDTCIPDTTGAGVTCVS